AQRQICSAKQALPCRSSTARCLAPSWLLAPRRSDSSTRRHGGTEDLKFFFCAALIVTHTFCDLMFDFSIIRGSIGVFCFWNKPLCRCESWLISGFLYITH